MDWLNALYALLVTGGGFVLGYGTLQAISTSNGWLMIGSVVATVIAWLLASKVEKHMKEKQWDYSVTRNERTRPVGQSASPPPGT